MGMDWMEVAGEDGSGGYLLPFIYSYVSTHIHLHLDSSLSRLIHEEDPDRGSGLGLEQPVALEPAFTCNSCQT
ncbi:GD25299 [Drosophila simulans]|uniref:GD25299 n=1 Tax=Drosophila simulans TaxID=7240 RepID=B4QEJ7_DROSI|nr:GD25299 [Drosophila simulans]